MRMKKNSTFGQWSAIIYGKKVKRLKVSLFRRDEL